ncbi:MAG TPA: Ig-like domain-containing protein [Thermoanaerobaculia bacterium]|nr:Ig-like domain-containing protein [Thermoanaerobaculia bacterium]
MKKTTVAWMALIALTLLLPVHLLAQAAPTVRELIPPSAPAGARVMVSGRGLADPAITVAFGTLTAAAVQRNDRFIEVVVPSAAATGKVRVTLGTTLLKELSFTVTTDPKYIVSTLAGGKQTQNQVFKHPNGAAVVLPDGRVAVADEQHHQIKLVTPAGVVSVLAGSGKQGSKDGKGTAAEFKAPRNLTFDPVNRVLFVSDTGNSNIRRVALDGTVTIVAGNGKQGYKDGTGVAAQFRDPHGLTVGSDGAVYVCDTKNNRIRRIAANGAVTTFAGTGAKDKLTDGALLSALFNEPKGIAADGATLYVADTKNNAIRKIAGGQVTTVLSFPRTGDDDDPEDGIDGNPNVLKRPSGIGVDDAGNLIVSDSENDFIRKIKLSTTPATMVTIAGTGKNGQVDGDGAIAQFKDPIGLSVAGAIYVADEDNDSVRRLCPEVRATGLFSPTGAVTAGTEVRLFGTGFVPGGTTVKFGSTAATDITWITASELAVKLPATIAGGSIAVTISSCGGTTPAVSFVVDNTAPVLTIANGGAPLVTGTLFKVPVTPVLTATDDIDPAPRVVATLNTLAFVSGTTVTADGVYTLAAYAEDAAGNRSATQTVIFTIDTTPPVVKVIERGAPFTGGVFNRPVEIDAVITDLTTTTRQPTIDGAQYVLKQPYAEQGTHSFSLKVTDALGFETTVGPIAFTIDVNGPALTVTSHTEGQVVTSRDATIKGETDGAVSVKVNGVNAAIDAATGTYTLVLSLLEGENTIAVTGLDAAGNPGSTTRRIVLDTRAPQLTVEEAASCTKSGSLVLRGTVSDPNLDMVVAKLGEVSTSATLTGTSWTATIALGVEGRKSILIEATDTTGHLATEQVTLTFDKTAPAIEITESGAPLTATIFNRKVTPFVRATDADANATVTATLNGAAWTSGTEIGGERSHTLQVKAKDCAGNELTRELAFSIDLTSPRFLTFSPASGSKVTQAPAALSGTVDADAVEVRVVEKDITRPAANGAFTLPEPGFEDGVNEITLEVIDQAGNAGRASYTLGVKTTKPLVEIIEGGAAMAEGTVYTRSVKPEIRVFEGNVTATATLDGAPFTSGTEITAGGAHTIVATATDSAFGQTNTITRHFTIDRTGPQVAIVSPADGTAFEADRTDVRVTAGDAVSVSVNGVAAARQADASWIAANVALDFGETTLAAVARDAAGNNGSASVVVTRGGAGPALVLTFPPDNYVTNRPKLDVSGRVLRQGSTVVVTVPPAAAASVATDPAGTFRVSGAELEEGEWTVTATATEGGRSTSAQARVTADFTPPRVSILESGVVFEDGAGFGTEAVISGDATDRNEAIDFTLTIDGAAVASPVTITANGGHTAILTARDAAGNEARLERTFYVGTGGVGGCRLEAFDPPDQSIIASQRVELIGRSGGAAGVKVNGVAAKMSNGSFCANVELPEEGPNTVTIICTNADGTPLGDPVTITLVRVTNEPSVTITDPDEDHVTHDATLVVTGTLGNGAVSVDVNGKPATIAGTNWTVTGVRLTDGVNVLVARAKNTAGRTAVASRRVTYIADAPAISISSPVPGFVSGVSTTDISGTFSNVDPASLAVTGFAGAVEATAWSDTTGKFVARNVPLQSGDNTVAVTGRDRTGRLARAEVAIRYLSASPVVTITEPADGDYFPASQGETFRVSGTFRGEEGSTIDVNGAGATVDGIAKTFFADVTFSTLPGGITPVVARIAQPSGGEGAFDSLRVYKLFEAPKVLETFPAANAIEVDPGVVVLALFSAPMDRASTVDAFRLENASGTPVNGKSLLDKDVLTFAPATTLTPGERYTIKIATTAKDLAGQPLATAVDSSFVVATSAPTTAPTITTASGRICAQLVEVTGTSIPGARVRLDYGQIYFTTNASATGAFSYKVPLSGQAGYHVIRVRTLGADGTLSAAAELKLNLDCTGPRVLRASYDRGVNQLTIVFSNEVKPETLTPGAAGTIQLVLPDDRVVGGTISASGANVIVTPAENLGAATFTLKVTRDVEDKQGRKLELAHTQLFAFGDEEDLPPGYGFISGEVYDATTGRPLAGADIAIEVPTAAFARRVGSNALTATTQAVTMTTDARGRYTRSLPEGAHTIRASANGYTSVWRQIIVPAGAGVIPIDIRLTRRGEAKNVETGALSLVHGGNSSVTRRAELSIPAGAIASGASVTLTSTGAQSLAGLLPLGWSPLASAEIISTAATLGASTLAFDVPQADITAAAQTITAVRYDDSRDEWRVLVPVVNIANGKASFDAAAAGAYALVYADRRPGLTVPIQSGAGAPLTGIADPCAGGTCPAMVARSFPLSPEVVLPTGSTVATLNIDGAAAHLYPSGTAVQAYIDEELRLADGGRELDPPFATDLLLYRDLAGNTGIATFNLAPSPRAAEVFLEVGFDHIRILPYPGRLDRGTLIGPEGGRVPADDKVSVEIPTGATQDALRATASSLADPTSLGPIAGYTIVGGFQLTLERAGESTPADIDGDGVIDPVPGIELSKPARATFTVDASKLPAGTPQLILAELLETTPFNNRIFRLAAEMTSVDGGRWTTKSIDRNVLPIDGVIREGRYVLLAANAPIAFARGVVKFGSGAAARDARLSTAGLGVADLSRVSGIFSLPVAATPAAPFTLVPRTVALGDGTTYTHGSSPAAGAVVNVGDLVIVAQPPQVTSTIPSNNATNVSLTTTVEATITPGVDPSSVNAGSLTVIDTTNGTTVSGTVTANGTLGVRWTLPPGETLKQGRRYVAAVASTVRGTNGTPLQQAYTFSFTTAAVVTNDETHPERIRITIPDANGVSRVIGTSGALKAGWLAVPARRDRDFLTRYSTEAATDGSFTVTIGTDPRDRISIADAIDLRVLNNNGALIAIIPLTPFVSEDGKGFVSPANTAVTFTSVEGIRVDVPSGAFDVATLVEIEKSAPSVFGEVPRVFDELNIVSSVTLKFEGRARQRLQLSLPVPAGTALADNKFILGFLGESVRGPRIMAVDTLYSKDGGLTTVKPSSSVRGRVQTLTGVRRDLDPKDMLQGAIEQGRYAAFVMHEIAETSGLAWVLVDGLATAMDLFWDTMFSMYVGHRYVAEQGTVVFPVPADRPFRVTGVDPATSLTLMDQPYGALPVGDPGTVVVIETPEDDTFGPHPVFASPTRIEAASVPPATVEVEAVRNVKFLLSTTGGLSLMQGTPFDTATEVAALNVDTGERVGPQSLPISLSNVEVGHRIVLTFEEHDVDPSTPVSVVFSEPISIGSAAGGNDETISDYLKQLVKLEQVASPVADGVDVLQGALLRLDSGGRRVNFLLPSPLAAGERFRVTLKKEIKDRSSNNLQLGQAGEKNSSGAVVAIGPAPVDMAFWFETRGPEGKIGEFDISQSASVQTGYIRELARFDNILFVAAVDGGILAYDISNPEALDSSSSPKPMALAPGLGSGGVTAYWNVQVDHHGRIFSTGVGNMFGAFRSFRVEDFIKAKLGTAPDCNDSYDNEVCQQIGGAMTSQNPGSAYGVGLPSAVVADDRVEAIPRKVKIVATDSEPLEFDRDAFPFTTSASGPAAGLQTIVADIPPFSPVYRIQRVTVENLSLGLRWSADAKAVNANPDLPPAHFDQIIAYPGDRLRVTHNLSTHAVVNLFGYGLGVFDVNAIESNDRPAPPGWVKPIEQVSLRANVDDPPAPPSSTTIGDLAFSPDSAILGLPGGGIRVYSLDTRKGVVELAVTLPNAISPNGQTVFTAGNSRFDALRAAVGAAHPSPILRFNSIAAYRNPTEQTDWLLIPALDYGLLAVEAGALPLTQASFADVIWFPHGAYAVTVMEKSNTALVVDGKGAVHLVDLSRLDERDAIVAGNPLPPGAMFPTALGAINGTGTYGYGKPDPRVLWRSEEGLSIGQVPPAIDPETGIFYTGQLLARKVTTGSAIDPRTRFIADFGDGRAPREINTVVPLGIEPPANVLKCRIADDPDNCRASLGAFRLEISLPGSLTESLSSSLGVAVESERLPEVLAPQTPDLLPPSHVRQSRPDGTTDLRGVSGGFNLHRVLDDPSLPVEWLRYQRGWNRFVSDWIVAIADPRASRDYDAQWGTTTYEKKEDLGCFSCVAPKYVKDDPDTQELYTAGRFITVRPEFTSGSGPYSWLGTRGRMRHRVTTTMADTVRPTNVLVAAQNPPLASGVMQDRVYLHSGEVETGSTDLDAGGRANWNLTFDRTYRSRTLGYTPLGFGWDSGIFKRLRPLPSGDIEYRDGTGEVYLYRLVGGQYLSPKGYFERLARSGSGWVLTDQKRRLTYFDQWGRVQREGDEFFTEGGNGNVITYLYDGQSRLIAIVDPNERVNDLHYYESGTTEGQLKGVEDWRQRFLGYEFDASLRLKKVKLPKFGSATGIEPEREYTYDVGAAGSYADKLELATNLRTVEEPDGSTRITFTYTGPRDVVKSQRWATGEVAEFTIVPGADADDPPTVSTKDVLGQERTYTFKMPSIPAAAAKNQWYWQDRVHIESMTEMGIDVYEDAEFGELPDELEANASNVGPKNRQFNYTYEEDGLFNTVTLAGVSTRKYKFTSAGEGLGKLLECEAVGADGSSPCDSDAVVKTTYSYNGGYLQTTTANGEMVQTPEPHRGTPTTVATNNGITTTTTYDLKTGLPTNITTTGGTAGDPTGSTVVIKYPAPPSSVPPFKRGRPEEVVVGGVLKTVYTYVDQNTDRVDDGRNTTETQYDEWRRPLKVRITNNAGDPLTIEETFTYEANGRVYEHTRKQTTNSGIETVTITTEYDDMGRVTSVKTTNVDVNGSLSDVTETTDYSQFESGTIKTEPVGQPEIETSIDKLGRTTETKQKYGSSGGSDQFLRQLTAYDLAGNPAYITDTRDADALAFDAAGRLVQSMSLDGSKQKFVLDGWNRVTDSISLDAADNEYYRKTTKYATGGLVEKITETAGGQTRDVTQQWDAGGRIVRVGGTASGANDGGRATFMKFDEAGRMQFSEIGQGSVGSMDRIYERSVRSSYGATQLPLRVEEHEPSSISPSMRTIDREYDTLGAEKRVTIDTLVWTGARDQRGEIIRKSLPTQTSSSYEYDSKGRLLRETAPDGTVKHYQHNDTGAKVVNLDEESEQTTKETDLVGRVTQLTYPDGSTEKFVYDGPRLGAIKNRQDLWQSFAYNDKGQLETVYASEVAAAGATRLDEIAYDETGRVKSWKTRDALIEYSDFTIDDLPQTTKHTRYKDGSGFTDEIALDTFTVGHKYNGYGEVTEVSMPETPGAAWIQKLEMSYDARGNLVELKSDGSSILSGIYRNAGRPDERTVHITPEGCTDPACLKTLVRAYTYKPETSQLESMIAKIGGVEVAGSKVTYNDSLQVAEEELRGVSGGTRRTRYSYDDRGRLFGAASGVADGTAASDPSGGSTAAPGVTEEHLTPADFRTVQERAPTLDTDARQKFIDAGIDPDSIDPPSANATPRPGHKIDQFQKGGPTADQFKWERSGSTLEGAVRTEDGQFRYGYDEKQRLIWVAEKPQSTAVPIRRMVYGYDGNDRLVARTAQYATVSSLTAPVESLLWNIEDRPHIIAADGVPAELTFVWDVVTDRLLAIYKTGSSAVAPTDPNGNLLRQFVHGDLGIDDPVAIITIDIPTVIVPGALLPVTTLYPVYDEAANGSLQVVLNRNGEVVGRNLMTDPYGAENFEISGAAIESVKVKVEKDSTGKLETINIRMRATEALDAATIATGTHLAIVKDNGAVAATSTVTALPVAGEEYSLEWTLTGPQWKTFHDAGIAAGGTSLSMAVTDDLRASAWAAGLPFLAPPDWARAMDQPVFSSPQTPFEVRERLTLVTGFIDGIAANANATDTPYEVESLAFLGSSEGYGFELLTAAVFQAQPFADPFSRKNYVRARWYDPETATWLTPDPEGYDDSSNLYSFAGGDPVNARDPEGESFVGKAIKKIGKKPTKALIKKRVRTQIYKAFRKQISSNKKWRGLFEIHHIVPKSFFDEFGTFLDDIGYEIDSVKNLITLRRKDLDAAVAGFKRGKHKGWTKLHSEYNQELASKLRVIQDAKDAGKLTKQEALEQVQALSRQLRDDLRTGKIQLAPADVEALSKGTGKSPLLATLGLVGITMVTPGMVADAKAEEVVEEMDKRERAKNAFVKYGTADHYFADEGFGKWVGLVIDFINPISDVADISDLLEDLTGYDWVTFEKLVKEDPEAEEAEEEEFDEEEW